VPEFIHSHDFLRRDGLRRSALKIAVCFGLISLWSYWFGFASIGVYETSEVSEMEASEEIHPIQVDAVGRISRTFLTLGKPIQAGDLLLELDDSDVRLELNEFRERLDGLGPQLDHLHQEISSQQAALEHESDELREARHEAESISVQAQSRAAFAGRQADLNRSLYSIGTLAQVDVNRALSNAHEQAAAAEGAQATVEKIGKQQRRDHAERLAGIQNLYKQESALESDRQTFAAQIKRLEHEVEKRRVYAPVSGTLAEVEPVKPGTVVQVGQKIATVLPSSGLKVVAQFLPAAVAGRIKPGQPARLLAERFPWSQYGAVPLTVQTVGTDVHDAHIKVELLVSPSVQTRIPLQHGLRGTTEVLVERATPLEIALRVAGRYLGSTNASRTSAESPE